MKVSILIPVYNEFLTMPMVIERVLESPLPGVEKEIIIVDDGSTDGTSELLQRYKSIPGLQVHHSNGNFGKGAALRFGISKATGDILLVQDGDLEYSPQDYPRVLEPILSGQADVVYGSRFLTGKIDGMKWSNRLGNRILTLAANILFGAQITDEATAYKAFRASVLRHIELQCTRFEFCPEVTAKVLRLGYRIHEVPISYNPRGILEGKKVCWRDGIEALLTLLRYRLVSINSFAHAGEAGTEALALRS